VRQKFAPGALEAFLKKPEAHYAWIRMPNFRLSDEEAGQLAAYLNRHAEPPRDAPVMADVALLERGRALVRTSGCLNCHSSSLRNEFATHPLIELAPAHWNRGCMDPSDQAAAPRFHFSLAEAAALRAFAGTDRVSLERRAPVEFAERQIRQLNCAACHGQYEGFPHLDVLGGKLKPEWAARFIAGEVEEKPRPWLASRMPAFASRAAALAHGMALDHGYAAKTPEEPAIDEAALEIGRRLVSAEGGFACIGCHGVADVAPTQVFESAGINLALTHERLLQPFFERWILNPLAIDPTTKMPAYFAEAGRSPLGEVLEGDGLKQIRAMWEYVRRGDKMPPPPGTFPGAPATAHDLEGFE
jgi:mono/diheme cytochrome c family protein